MYDVKLDMMVRLQSWSLGNVQSPFIAITFMSTKTRNGSTCLGDTSLG